MVPVNQAGCLIKGPKNGFAACHGPRVNNQWSIWYCVFALALQIYIIVCSIQRFTRYVSLPWSPQGQPHFELNAYVAFIGAAVVLLPFFIISALMKVGNYANDGQKIGEDEQSAVVYQNLRRKKWCQWMKAVWKHGGPVAPLIHLAISMCLLLPRLLIEAQIIKHGLARKGAVWRTDLDFLVPHKDRLVTMRFLATLNVTEIWGQQDSSTKIFNFQIDGHAAPTPEFMNYIVALVVFTLRYPAIFWRANRCFGLIFSIYSLLTALQQILTFVCFSVLYKVHTIGPNEVLLRFSPLLLKTKLATVCFLAYSFFLTLSLSVLYFYGLQKYKEWVDSLVESHLIRWKQESRRLWAVAPHLSAFGCLIAITASASPLMYDYIMVYCGSLDGVVLACVTGAIVHILLWIILWLVLTIKHRWEFTSKAVRNIPRIMGCKTSGQTAPLLVIDHGQTYQIRANDSKKAILNVVQRTLQASVPKASPVDDEDIYWLKPRSLRETDRSLTWGRNQRKSSSLKHKTIFQDALDSSVTGKKTRSLKKSPKISSRSKKHNVKFEDLSDSDDGDYATLMDMTGAHDYRGRGNGSKRHCLENQTYKKDYENLEIHSYPSNCKKSDGGDKSDDVIQSTPLLASDNSRANLKREDLSLRSGSISESSTSPEKGTSDSSSGVHSSCSLSNKRSSSMENLMLQYKPLWKTMSLQRGETPCVVPTNNCKLKPQIAPVGTLQRVNGAEGDFPNSKLGTFERATNIKMISFTDKLELSSGMETIDFSSKTNQNYPNAILPKLPTHERRDSANYSMASSADSEFSGRHS